MPDELDFSILDPANAVLTLRPDLKITPSEFDQEACYLIEDPLRGKFFRIGSDEFALISLLDGKNTIAQAIGLSAEALQEKAFIENEAMSVCHWLLESQLAVCGGGGQGERLATSARKLAQNKLAAAINPLSMRLPLWNPNVVLNKIAPYTEWMFGRPAMIGWCIICAIGFLIAASNRNELIESSSILLDRDNWLKLALAWLVLKLLHESAHALTCLHYGGNVPSAGVLLVLFTPLPFVDVTASWRFPSKWQRIATAAAGIYIELFIAALAIILWNWSTSSVVRHAALNVAATASFGSLVINGNPLMRFDGYYILSDWLELPNLSASGQKFLAGIFQKLLGIDVPPETRSPRTQRIIAIYAITSLFWRILVYVGLLLLLYAMVAKLGVFLAGIAVLMAMTAMLVLPIQKIVKYLLNQPALSRRRLGILGAAGLGCVIVIAILMTRPSTIRTWGVVDYSPPTIVRSISPGFVKEVKVHDGETVKAGDVLVVMTNDELQQELAEIRVDIEQSVIQERMLRQNEENAKAQAETAKGRSLKKKEAEILRLVEGLTVRAPIDGQVVAHDLDSLPGRYLSVGDEIVVVGNEESKEIILAAAQDDINSFTSQLYLPVTVRISGDESNSFTASLGKIDPRASLRLPHPALGADAGGALPVKPKKQKPDAKAPESELLDPCFYGTVSLIPSQSLLLHSGQRATILFSSSEQCWAGRLVMKLRKWIDDRLASSQQTS
jgi:putative peptide zinc metalloprotease protein